MVDTREIHQSALLRENARLRYHVKQLWISLAIALVAFVAVLVLATPASAGHKKPPHEWRNVSLLLLNVGRDLACFWVCDGRQHGNRVHYDVTLGNTLCVHVPMVGDVDRVRSVEDVRRMGEIR